MIKPHQNRALQIIATAERDGCALTCAALKERLGYRSRGAVINLAHRLRGLGLIVIDKRRGPRCSNSLKAGASSPDRNRLVL